MLSYEITELALPSEAQAPGAFTEAWAVNIGGSVAGDASLASGAIEPILWNSPDAPQALEPFQPGGIASGINDGGDVVGLISWAHAFIYHHSNGELEDLAPVVGDEANSALEINNEGVVVGGAGPQYPNSPGHGFVYDSSSGSVDSLPPLPGDTYAIAMALNESRHVVGWSQDTGANPQGHLFLYREGKMEGRGDIASPNLDINNADVITGSRIFPTTPIANAFRLNVAAIEPSFVNLGESLPAGFSGSGGNSINDDHVIVGYALDADNELHAMIYLPDGPDAGWHDLNDAVLDGDGWHLAVASAISNAGHIVGVGTHRRRHRGFLLSPLTAQTGGEDKIAKVLLELIMMFGGAPFGGAGIGITGGGHPVPIGPQEFARLWRRMSAPERDAYVGIAIRNLGGMVTDRDTRAEVERVAIQIVETATREARNASD
jgi:uncharacterized membrane protein